MMALLVATAMTLLWQRRRMTSGWLPLRFERATHFLLGTCSLGTILGGEKSPMIMPTPMSFSQNTTQTHRSFYFVLIYIFSFSRSYPTVVARFAPRPISVTTVEQAILYHRSELEKAGASFEKIRADARVGNFCLLAHKCGLANALWEAEEEHLVREGLDICRKIRDIELETDPRDSHCLRRFVIDVSLEVGEWDAATAVLAKFPESVDEDLVWIAVLVYFKSRGPESKTTRKALEEAVRFNPVVYSIPIGDRLLEDGESHRCRQRAKEHYTVNGPSFGLPHNAPIFYHNYSKYFFQDPAPVSWLDGQRETLEPLLSNVDMEKPLDSPIDGSLADYFAAAVVGDVGIKKKSAAAKLGNDAVCCANCGGIGNLFKCSRCQHVCYCGRPCQLEHWKDHKAACRKSAEQQGGPQTRASDSNTTTAQERLDTLHRPVSMFRRDKIFEIS
jgi:MYND finger